MTINNQNEREALSVEASMREYVTVLRNKSLLDGAYDAETTRLVLDIWDGCASDIEGRLDAITPTSPPPSEVRVTGEQVEAAARAIYEASAHGDSEDMARAAFAAAGIPVAGEGAK